jgi:hypothetical protein
MSMVPFRDSSALFSLSLRNELFVDGKMLLSDCNSFAVHDAFVLATTNRFVFLFIRVSLGNISPCWSHSRHTLQLFPRDVDKDKIAISLEATDQVATDACISFTDASSHALWKEDRVLWPWFLLTCASCCRCGRLLCILLPCSLPRRSTSTLPHSPSCTLRQQESPFSLSVTPSHIRCLVVTWKPYRRVRSC